MPEDRSTSPEHDYGEQVPILLLGMMQFAARRGDAWAVNRMDGLVRETLCNKMHPHNPDPLVDEVLERFKFLREVGL